MMASLITRAVTSYCLKWAGSSLLASVAVGSDLVSEAGPDVSLQKARSWDEGVSSNFSTTPLPEIFKGKKVVIFGLPGAYTGVCSQQHVPSYKNKIAKFKAKGVDSIICIAVNDPYSMNGWVEKLHVKDAASRFMLWFHCLNCFHKSLELTKDISGALLVLHSESLCRWFAHADGKMKVLNIEDAPSEFKVLGGEVILEQI